MKRVWAGISVFVSVKLDRQIDDALANFEKAVRLMPEVVDWLMINRDSQDCNTGYGRV